MRTRALLPVALVGLLAMGCARKMVIGAQDAALPTDAAGCRYPTFGAPEAVPIVGYSGVLMEPFVTRDGATLYFNDSNAPGVDTNLHVARFDGPNGALRYVGPLTSANSRSLDAVASVDQHGNFYFVSTRSYDSDASTIYRGALAMDGSLGKTALVPGVTRATAPWVNFDAEVSASGLSLYLVDGYLDTNTGLWKNADLVLATTATPGAAFTRAPPSDGTLLAINTGVWEYAAATTADELELYFTRADPANGVLPSNWVTTRARIGDPFCPPIHIDAMEGFVEASTVSSDGAYVYYHRQEGASYALYRLRRTAP